MLGLTSCWPCRSRWSSCPDRRWPPAAHWQGRKPSQRLELCEHCRKHGAPSGCWSPTAPQCHCQKHCPAGSASAWTASGRGWAEEKTERSWFSRYFPQIQQDSLFLHCSQEHLTDLSFIFNYLSSSLYLSSKLLQQVSGDVFRFCLWQ